MDEMPIANSPGYLLGVDLIRTLYKSDEGNSYALITIDPLTGWAEAILVPNKSADAVH